jgi:hypothetical protein
MRSSSASCAGESIDSIHTYYILSRGCRRLSHSVPVLSVYCWLAGWGWMQMRQVAAAKEADAAAKAAREKAQAKRKADQLRPLHAVRGGQRAFRRGGGGGGGEGGGSEMRTVDEHEEGEGHDYSQDQHRLAAWDDGDGGDHHHHDGGDSRAGAAAASRRGGGVWHAADGGGAADARRRTAGELEEGLATVRSPSPPATAHTLHTHCTAHTLHCTHTALSQSQSQSQQ